MDSGKVDIIVRGLEECKSKIAEWETKPVSVKDSPEFDVWEEEVANWLRLGGSATVDLHVKFMNTLLFNPKSKLFGDEGYDADDQQAFNRGLALTRSYINAAIRNLRLGFEYDVPQKPQRTGRGDVNVHVSLTNVTVSNVVELLQQRIASLPDTAQKKSLLDKLNDIGKHPLFNTLANVAISSLVNPGGPPKP